MNLDNYKRKNNADEEISKVELAENEVGSPSKSLHGDLAELYSLQIRVGSASMRQYISYALTLLTEKGKDSIVLSSISRNISKSVAIGKKCLDV